MVIVKDLIHAFWHQDFEALANPSLVLAIYSSLFIILFLENGLLPAAFLPGDSLLILVGVLIAKGTLSFPITLLILTSGASLGCWLSYIQGRWLGNTAIVQKWLRHLPDRYYQRAHDLFHRHGLSALLLARFIAFVRTLLPTLVGLSGLSNVRFQFFNWVSGFLWVLILTLIGFAIGKTSLFQRYEDKLIFGLMMLPLILLVAGLCGTLLVIWRKNKVQAETTRKKE